MASLEAVSAVSAVVSAFHGGADLVKQMRKKSSKASKKQTERSIMEKMLQDALETGETQISERYSAHFQELGPRFQTGDAAAKDRLLHIAVMMQSELIRSLQITLQFETASLDVIKLQEDALLHRRDALTALDELRGRLLNEYAHNPAQEYLNVLPRRPSFESIRTYMTSHTVSSDFVPQAVTIPSPELEPEEQPKRGFSRLLSIRSNSSKRDSMASSRLSFTPNLDWLRPVSQQSELEPAPLRVHPAMRPNMHSPPLSSSETIQQQNNNLITQRLSTSQRSEFSVTSDYSDKIVVEMEDTSPGPRLMSPFQLMPAPPTSSSASSHSMSDTRSSRFATPGMDSVISSEHTPITPPLASPTSSTHSAFFRGHYRAPSSASSSSHAGTTTSIATTTVPANILVGRPTKSNNYWGFCKGSWTISENPRKGLSLTTKPSGMYNSVSVWRCKCCAFEGDVFGTKKVPAFDERIYKHTSGSATVRYKWIFLAKSHIKKKQAPTAAGPANPKTGNQVHGGSSFGCILCVAEGRATGVFGNVDSLMAHIAQEHGSTGVREDVRGKCKYVVGGVEFGLDWDVNILPDGCALGDDMDNMSTWS